MDGEHHKSAVADDKAKNRLEVFAPMLATDELDNLPDLTPDQVLSIFGSTNLYLLFIWAAMANVWCLTAFPIMVSAFIMGEPCVIVNSTMTQANCHPAEGALAKEFNLTANNNGIQLSDITAMGFVFGGVVGSTFLPFIADIKGRQPVLVWSLFTQSLLGCLSAFAPNIYLFILSRFLQGVCTNGSGSTPWVLAYESVPLKLRSYTAMVFGLFWVVGYCSLGPMAYFVQDWRHLIIVGTSPMLLFSVLYYLLFHELLTNRRLLLYTVVLVYLWTCDNFVYYGLSLFSTQLAGNRYINFMLIGAVEIPSYLVSPTLLDRLGRRTFVSLCHFLAAISFFTILFTDNNPGVTLSMWLLGKFAISCAFTCLFVYASEVFPTVSRNGCIGICSIVGNLGGVFAPTVRSMVTLLLDFTAAIGLLHHLTSCIGKFAYSNEKETGFLMVLVGCIWIKPKRFTKSANTARQSLISPMLPLLFFGVSAAMGGLFTLLLPETVNKELPDLPEQMVTGVKL